MFLGAYMSKNIIKERDISSEGIMPQNTSF